MNAPENMQRVARRERAKATQAARSASGQLAIADLSTDRPDGATDLNDMAAPHGLEAVKQAIASPSVSARAEHQPGGGDVLADDQATIARLAALPLLDYDRVRKAEAQKLGVRVETLDRQVDAARGAADADPDADESVLFPELEHWPNPVDGAALLSGLADLIKRFMILPTHADTVVALWIVFTYCIDVAQVAPILVAASPEKRCGKSTLLFLLVRLVNRALPSSNITSAALFRSVEKWQPTLIVDEADSFLRESDELRGVLNSGHTRDTAFVIRTVGDDHDPRRFSTWGAKAIALIGTLPDTLHDRSIVIPLRRKLSTERAAKVRHADPADFEKLARQCSRFAADHTEALRRARPAIPEVLHDRAGDNWEPLLAIADLAGGKWPEEARAAAKELAGVAGNEADSLRVALLADICTTFKAKDVDKISSVDLIASLTADAERPWVEFHHGKPISSRQLARMLSGFGIGPNTLRDGEKTFKGYQIEQFVDAAARYLPNSEAEHRYNQALARVSEDSVSVTQSTMLQIGGPLEVAPSKGCDGVTDKTPFFEGADGGMTEVEV